MSRRAITVDDEAHLLRLARARESIAEKWEAAIEAKDDEQRDRRTREHADITGEIAAYVRASFLAAGQVTARPSMRRP